MAHRHPMTSGKTETAVATEPKTGSVAGTSAYTDIAALGYGPMRQMMLEQAKSHELPVLQDTDTQVEIGTPIGAFGVTERDSGDIRLRIESHDADSLVLLRTSLMEHFEYYLPDVAKTMIWSDAPQEGVLPPNFQFAEVVSCELLGSDFLRLVLRPDDLAKFDNSSLHFRFVFQPEGTEAPVWPGMQENGSVKWPTGAATLHRPVYTARALNQATGQMSVDVFRHDGGRTTQWAETAQPGDRVALIGPGGNGVPEHEQVLMFGDETAYPAIARMIENLPEGCTGKVVLFNQSGHCDYPMPTRTGIELRWLKGASPAGLAATAYELLTQNPAAYMWFAAEARPVKALRTALKEAKLAPDVKPYTGTYWTRADA